MDATFVGDQCNESGITAHTKAAPTERADKPGFLMIPPVECTELKSYSVRFALQVPAVSGVNARA